jgi:CBS domain containing-hemolysin-like protein
MSRDCQSLDPESPLKNALESMHERQCTMMPVLGGKGHIVGLLTLENISEMLIVNAALDRQGKNQAIPRTFSTPIL